MKYLWVYYFSAPPSGLVPNTRYEKLIEAFGGKGYFATTAEEVDQSMSAALEDRSRSSIINVMINPLAQRKTQVHETFDYITTEIGVFTEWTLQDNDTQSYGKVSLSM